MRKKSPGGNFAVPKSGAPEALRLASIKGRCLDSGRLSGGRHSACQRAHGFTLIELMVVLSVVAILLVAAVPGFQSAINSNRLSAASNEMLASLQTARMEAIRRNRRTLMCFSANATAASPVCGGGAANGWLTFVDADRNGAYNGGDTMLRIATINSPLVLLAGASPGSTVMFRSDGMVHDASDALVDGVIDLCIPTTQPAQNVRHIQIDAGSRISIAAADGAGQCKSP